MGQDICLTRPDKSMTKQGCHDQHIPGPMTDHNHGRPYDKVAQVAAYRTGCQTRPDDEGMTKQGCHDRASPDPEEVGHD